MIFIDTGAFLARYLEGDQFHVQATRTWAKIKEDQELCFTSNFVLDETFTLLGRQASYAFSAERAKNIYASNLLKILRPTKLDEINAIEFFSKYSDHAVSFTDCISFVLMNKEKINRVFSFDKHFQYAGFEPYTP